MADTAEIKSNPQRSSSEQDDQDEEASTSTNNGDKDDQTNENIEGAYDPSKYELPDIPSQVKNLFSFITHYSPQMIEIGHRLKPFIPDYIPTVGHVDTFIKIPFPDDRTNQLGLKILDEPNIEQTDSTLLQIKLKALSKEIVGKKSSVKTGNDADETGTMDGPLIPLTRSINDINKWVDNIQELHENTARPESSLLLIHQQPDYENIDNLMQEWPEELETTLNVHSIPTAELDCTLEEYISIMAAILDIPIQNNKITSLYLMFSLLNEFQNSQHFNKYEQP